MELYQNIQPYVRNPNLFDQLLCAHQTTSITNGSSNTTNAILLMGQWHSQRHIDSVMSNIKNHASSVGQTFQQHAFVLQLEQHYQTILLMGQHFQRHISLTMLLRLANITNGILLFSSWSNTTNAKLLLGQHFQRHVVSVMALYWWQDGELKQIGVIMQ